MSTSKKPLFVFVCDSHFNPPDADELKPLGLIRHENFDFAGAGGARNIMSYGPETGDVEAEHLLVFTGSFHGNVSKAVTYAKEIKAINPNAKIYFRSATKSCNDPVFDGNVLKRDTESFHDIIRKFMEEAAQTA